MLRARNRSRLDRLMLILRPSIQSINLQSHKWEDRYGLRRILSAMRDCGQASIEASHPMSLGTRLAGGCTSCGTLRGGALYWVNERKSDWLRRYGNIKDMIQTARGPESKLRSIDYFAASGASGMPI